MTRLLILALLVSFFWPFSDFLQHNYVQLHKSTFLPVYQVAFLCFAHAVLAFAALLFLCWRFPAKKNRLIAITILLSVLWFTFSPILELVGGAVSGLGFTTGGVLAYAVIACALIVAVWRMAKSALFLKAAAVAVVVASVSPLVGLLTSPQATGSENAAEGPSDGFGASFDRSDETKPPNIYYIIADGWMATDVFERVVDGSLGPLIEDLEAKGFYSVPRARSNYLGSASSIGSLFHLDYFRTDQHAKDDIANSSFFPAIAYRTPAAPLVTLLKDRGYELYFSGTWYSNCTGPHFNCVSANWWRLNRASVLLLERTPLKFTVSRFIRLEVDAVSRLDEDFIAQRKAAGTPSFTFAHHMEPHSPWYFDGQCRPLDPSAHEDQVLYSYSAQCLLRRVATFADNVARLDPGAIVVVHGDHGWLFASDVPAGTPEHLWPVEALDQRARVANLIKIPERCEGGLRPDLGPVNTMRLVMACAAGVEPVFLPEALYVPGPTYGEDERFMLFDTSRL